MATDFTLPELGENIAAGDVLRILVVKLLIRRRMLRWEDLLGWM